MDYDVLELVTRLIAITGTEPWSRKLASLRWQLKDNEFLGELQSEHFGMELKLFELLEEQQRSGVFPIQIRDHMHYKVYGFAAGIVRIYERLSAAGQKRLQGMLRDGLQPDNSLLSLQHEILTAIHLMGRGYDVTMNDLESGAGVDFIATLDGLELEIECKMFTGDIGRQIHRRKALALHRHLSETLKRAYVNAAKGLLVRVTIPARLTCSQRQLRDIEATVSTAIRQSCATINTDECQVDVVEFDVADSPFNVSGPEELTQSGVTDFIQEKVQRTNKDLMIIFSPRQRALIMLVESVKPDAVLRGVYRQLREAAKGQFSKDRPGILSVQFQDLSADQMESIATSSSTEHPKATGLQIMTSEFLASENRGHIHSVAYRSHGKVLAEEYSGANAIRETGLGYFIRNPNNSFWNDPRARVF